MTRTQIVKLIILVSGLSLTAFVTIHFKKTLLVPSIEYLEASSPYVLGFTITAVFYLLRHIDTISTSVSSIKTECNAAKVNKLQESYQNLNQEGITNVILSLSLFVISRLVKIPSSEIELSSFQIASISLKFSMLGTMLYVAYDQARSLHTAMQYRKIIEFNKKIIR